MKDFSWSVLFFVTGFSFLIFCVLLKMLEGEFSRPFLWIGLITLFLGLVERAGRLLAKAASKRKSKDIYS